MCKMYFSGVLYMVRWYILFDREKMFNLINWSWGYKYMYYEKNIE